MITLSHTFLGLPSSNLQISTRGACFLLGLKALGTNAAVLGKPEESPDHEWHRNKFYTGILNGCAYTKDLEEGKRVHAHLIITGAERCSFVRNRVIDMYAKCGELPSARQVFDKMPEPDGGSWNAMISGYARQGYGEKALKLFSKMETFGVKWNAFTLASVLGACAGMVDLNKAKQVHTLMIATGCVSNVILSSALVDVYAKCGFIEDARQVFDKMPQRNAVSWSVMIARYARLGRCEEAFVLFCQMQLAGIRPGKFTFANILTVCASLPALAPGEQLHACIIKTGFESSVNVGSALVDMYAKCGNIEGGRQVFDKMPERDVVCWTAMVAAYARCGLLNDARHLFDNMPERNIVSWNAMVAGYSQNSHGEEALTLFREMQCTLQKLDQVTFGSILNACASVMDLELGKQVHAYAIRSGFDSDVFVGNALLDMYAKCGSIANARQWFYTMGERDRVSWNAMIAGYVHHGQDREAIDMFWQMQQAGVKPTQFTFSSILSACATLADHELGKQVHAYIIKFGLESNSFIGSALVDMYAKCGSMRCARQAFDEVLEKDGVSWNAIIAGYAHNGSGEDALELFEQMLQVGTKPDHITFMGVLYGCIRAGLVDAGRHYFNSMAKDHYITPRVEHYGYMIELLGHAGHINEIDNFIKNMPFEPNATMWKSLLDASRIHGNVELGKHATQQLLELEPENTAPFVTLSNIYAAVGRLDDLVAGSRPRKVSLHN